MVKENQGLGEDRRLGEGRNQGDGSDVGFLSVCYKYVL